MIANAGVGYHGTLEQTPPDVVRRLMEVNYVGTYLSVRAALPVFKKQGSGHLIIMSSIVGRRGIAGSTAAFGRWVATRFLCAASTDERCPAGRAAPARLARGERYRRS